MTLEGEKKVFIVRCARSKVKEGGGGVGANERRERDDVTE